MEESEKSDFANGIEQALNIYERMSSEQLFYLEEIFNGGRRKKDVFHAQKMVKEMTCRPLFLFGASNDENERVMCSFLGMVIVHLHKCKHYHDYMMNERL